MSRRSETVIDPDTPSMSSVIFSTVGFRALSSVFNNVFNSSLVRLTAGIDMSVALRSVIALESHHCLSVLPRPTTVPCLTPCRLLHQKNIRCTVQEMQRFEKIFIFYLYLFFYRQIVVLLLCVIINGVTK